MLTSVYYLIGAYAPPTVFGFFCTLSPILADGLHTSPGVLSSGIYSREGSLSSLLCYPSGAFPLFIALLDRLLLLLVRLSCWFAATSTLSSHRFLLSYSCVIYLFYTFLFDSAQFRSHILSGLPGYLIVISMAYHQHRPALARITNRHYVWIVSDAPKGEPLFNPR